MQEFTRLVDIVATLRAPDGCPWDREQTIDSLKPFVLEETYEVLEAIDRHDHAALREELGDFLFEAVFLAQLEAEAGHFTIADSLTSDRRQAGAAAPARVRARRRRTRRSTRPDRCGRAGRRSRRRSAAARRSRRRSSAASRRRCRAAARVPDRHRAPRRSASTGARPPTSCDKIQEEVDELREVVDGSGADRPRARRGGNGRPAVLDREPVAASSASNPRPRCARRTTSSRSASRRWNSRSRSPAERWAT